MSVGCKKYSVELSAYFDGELEGEELAALEAHLDGCEGCRADLQGLERLHGAMASLSRPPLSRGSILEELNARLHLDDEEDHSPQ